MASEPQPQRDVQGVPLCHARCIHRYREADPRTGVLRTPVCNLQERADGGHYTVAGGQPCKPQLQRDYAELAQLRAKGGGG
jgi:hypothetical protein